MTHLRTWGWTIILLVNSFAPLFGQQLTSANTAVPPLVKFSGVMTDSTGKPLAGTVGVTFSLYKDEQGGAPLWVETQNVPADKSGHYAVTLGSTTTQGLPQGIFASGEARWLGVQVQGQSEQPRVLLLSVPYALKAADAETVGGLPPSAFVKAPSAGGAQTNATSNLPPLTGGGKPGFIAFWKTATKLASSKLFQSSAGNVGLGTGTPAAQFDVNGTEDIRNTLTLFPNGSAPTLTVNGTAFSVSNTGLLSFVSGQTFPGTAQLSGGNNFTGNQSVSGNVSATQLISNAVQGTAPLQLTSTTQVPNLNASFLDGLSASAFQVTGSYATLGANQFTATQTVGSGDLAINTGNLDLPQTGGGNVGVITLGGAPFIHACCANSAGNTSIGISAGAFNGGSQNNTAAGYQVLANTSAGNNTGAGYQALASDGQGKSNTAVGYQALYQNTSGNLNTAVGNSAGFTNGTAGSNNTLVGAGADVGADGLTFATAIGSDAVVSESNALVLGGTGANAVKVGIGTATPAATLDVQGTGNFSGLVTFAPGQTFAGTGTVTSVGSGAGLTGGPITTSGALSIATGGVSNAMLANPSLTVAAGTDLNGGGPVALGGTTTLNLDTTKVPLLAAANNFTGNQMVHGNLSASGAVTGSSFQIAGAPFAFGSYVTFNAFLGFAGNSKMTGQENTASGFSAFTSNIIGSANTANGAFALSSNTTGDANTATGGVALAFNTTGADNTASGYEALFSNTTGSNNTASGFQALLSNTTGSVNTASGAGALSSNTTGAGNTASGYLALFSDATGSGNTASGYQALYSNTTGIYNTASGYQALYSNTTGIYNTASGLDALYSNTTGTDNSAFGWAADVGSGNLSSATAIGAFAQVTASNALVLGSINGVNGAGASTNVGIGVTSPTYLLHIGNMGGASYNDFLRVEGPTAQGTGGLAASFGGYGAFQIDSVGTPGGRFVVTEIGRVGIGAPNPIVTDSLTIGQGTGHAIADSWDTYSSRRWKTNIQTLHGALAKVEQLRGVSYDLKESGNHEVGVIAEEVGAVVPEIVSWEENGKDAQGVDYSRLTALLIEATKEQQTLIHKQQQQIKAQQMQMRLQQAQIGRLCSQVTAIQTSLNARHVPSSETQMVNAQRPMMRQ
jgi:hypothetical protein